MSAFRRISLFALLIIAMLCGWAATKSDTFRVERSILIQASPEQVFPLMNDLKAFTLWSPYEGRDPAMQKTFSAETEGKGASYAWDGNDQVGSGRMEIMHSQAPQQVTLQLDFSKPFEAHNIVSFSLRPEGGGTRVIWAMEGPLPFMSKLMSIFFDMDAMVGQDFAAGLSNLKSLVEAANAGRRTAP